MATPVNNLLQEVKSSYLLYDPSVFSSELSREFIYQNPLYIKFFISKLFLQNITDLIHVSGLNMNFLTNYIYFYMDYFINPNSTTYNKDLYKNQYRPMRKGITNMIRLHTTGAIALPTEVRLHILASSKDVIHS